MEPGVRGDLGKRMRLTSGQWRLIPLDPYLSEHGPQAPSRDWFQQIHLRSKKSCSSSPFNPVVHPLSIRTSGLTSVASSNPVDLRRPRLTTYRCSLPGLTEFAASRRAGPDYQHYFPGTVPAAPRPRAGVQPRYSGLRVQGTASSPSSTTAGHGSTRGLRGVKAHLRAEKTGCGRM